MAKFCRYMRRKNVCRNIKKNFGLKLKGFKHGKTTFIVGGPSLKLVYL
jgi:hypothetical protein